MADDLRDEQLKRMLALTPAERIATARRLGEEGLRVFMSANGITSRREALDRLSGARNAGRQGVAEHDG